MSDPFDDNYTPAADESPAETSKETVITETVGDQNYVTIILKGGKGYGAPSVSIRAANLPDARRQVEDHEEDLKELLKLTAKLGKGYGVLVDGDAPAGSGSQGGRPQGATEHPDGKQEFCTHGRMRFLSGISKKTNKPYKMFVCDGDVPRDQQCKPKDA